MSTNAPTFPPTFLGISDEVDSCDCCGRGGLKRTVALRFEDGDLFYGVDCAARALGMTATAVRNAATNAQAAADAAADLANELRTVYAAAAAAFAAGDDNDPNLARGRRTFSSATPFGVRGTERWGMNLPAFLAYVADNGALPEPVAA
jgi:hypothetical protein